MSLTEQTEALYTKGLEHHKKIKANSSRTFSDYNDYCETLSNICNQVPKLLKRVEELEAELKKFKELERFMEI